MRYRRPRLPLYRLEELPRPVLIARVARDAVLDENRLDRLGPQQVSRIPHVDARRRSRSNVDSVPGRLIPGAVVWVRAADGEKRFGHDARGHGVVGPDAAVDEAAARFEVGGPVEDFGGQGDHAAGEAGQVLHGGFGVDVAGVAGFGVAGEEDVGVVRDHGAEEDVLREDGEGFFVHFSVCEGFGAGAKHHVLLSGLFSFGYATVLCLSIAGQTYFGQVLVGRVTQRTQTEVVVVER